MKTILICPAIRPAVTQLSATAPLAIVPLLGECLVSFWLEHLAGLGARHVLLVASDRPALVRAAVEDGRRWGLAVEVIEAHDEPTPAEAAALHRPADQTGWMPAPHDIVVMNSLPGLAGVPLFDSYASWFAALRAWMPQALTPARVRMRELRPGIWVGSGARISPRAQLHAPCWIGDHAMIEEDAVVGPNAIIEDRAIVSHGARVTDSVVGPDTFVGRLTAVAQSFAFGSLLVNWQNESVLRVPDSFLLCSLAELPAPSMPRAVAAAARVAARPLKFVATLFSRSNRAGAAKLSG